MAQSDANSLTSNTTCLSADDHGCNIEDHLLHYLGCIKISDRERFFTLGYPIWKEEVKYQRALCRNAREAERLVQEQINTWQRDCDRELSRIRFLRQTLRQDEDDHHLVEKVEESIDNWRKSTTYESGIKKVREWRGRTREEQATSPVIEPKNEKYDPEKDVSVPIIQFRDGEPLELTDGRVRNTFPNQKISLNNLLNDKEGSVLLREEPPTDRLVRYFHMPSNNMDWVERAISTYFGEERPDYQATRRELKRKEKTRAYMILRDSYWHGQVHGRQPRSPAHARYMKPLCTTVSSDPKRDEHFPKNMVLFMPYLHWDTSRKNEQFSTEVEEIMEVAKKKLRDSQKGEKEGRQVERAELHRNTPLQRSERLPLIGQKSEAKILTMRKLIRVLKERKQIKSRLEVGAKGRIMVKDPLGQLLLDSARLYEGMSNYRDKKLLRKYLPADPPLHPRRTLDQAYYWTLNSTWERDRDQVIYRETTAKPESFHRFDPESGTWPKHEEFMIKGECQECKTNIQKLSRVIMVDQLWMWILDAQTVITCFPKRYGTNKQDTSAIHKSIRLRIQESGPGQVRTVFDLGLIIIDECTNKFFNRTRTMDPQPQLIDAFSKAIGNIMCRQTTAFEKLWHWAHGASEIYRSKFNGNGDTSGLDLPVLDINPEGQLEREIKDIIEELDIIIHITKVHKKMLTAFIANAESILDPLGRFGKNQKRQMRSSHLHLRSEFSVISETIVGCYEEKDDTGDEKGQEDYIWFKLNAEELLETVNGRIEDLEDLRKSAVNAADDVKDLLELKQQQASVVQAWQAVKQSEETIKQGRSIMMFTLVTIIFLPLSFMSSVFGMNNMEITSSTWSINRQYLYMFSISAAVIFVSLVVAFGSWTRASIFYLWKWLVTTLLVRSGLYIRWLEIDWPSKRLQREANELSDRLKDRAKIAYFERISQEHAREDQNKQMDVSGQSAPRNNQGHGHSPDGSISTSVGRDSFFKFPHFSFHRRDKDRDDDLENQNGT